MNVWMAEDEGLLWFGSMCGFRSVGFESIIVMDKLSKSSPEEIIDRFMIHAITSSTLQAQDLETMT